MVPPIASKPNPSYSSTHITRKNYRGRSLLSQVGGKPTSARASSRLRANNTPTSSAPRPKSPQPATDDEPLSTSDEDSVTSYGSTGGNVSFTRSVKRSYVNGGKEQESDGIGETKRRKGESARKARSLIQTKRNQMSPVSDDTKLFSFQAAHKPRTTYSGYGGRDRDATRYVKNKKEKKIKRERGKGKQGTKNKKRSNQKERSPGPEFIVPPSIEDTFTLSQSPPFQTSQETEYTSSFPTSTQLEQDDIFSDENSTELSSTNSDISRELSLVDRRELGLPIPTITCPLCGKQIKHDDLEDEALAVKGKRFNQQSIFCRNHRVRDASNEWVKRKYPKIKWDSLAKRSERYFAELEDILSRRKASFYRNVLQEEKTPGKAMRLTIDKVEKVSAGYYGSQGSNIMYGSYFITCMDRLY